jgi:catechol 2,3-dioxygenase-like lactoylglutathione lyase family enzyme
MAGEQEPGGPATGERGSVERISAVTLVTADMSRAVRFYRSLGLAIAYGGEDAGFTSFRAGPGYLNLQLEPGWDAGPSVWGRVVFWVDDVDAMYARARGAGYEPLTAPADAPWGERYFHLRDADGHELSFARPLEAGRPEPTAGDPGAGG